MQDLEKLAQELRSKGKTEDLRALASSEDGRRLGAMIDGDAARRALQSGDSAALSQLMQGVLGTAEGRRLAQKLQNLMEK